MSTREQILSSEDRRIVPLPIPEWKLSIFVRSLTGTERDAFEETNLIRERDRKRGTLTFDVRMQNAKVRLVAMAVCDEAGNRVFTDEDVEALGKKSAAAIARIYNVAASLSGITDDDLEDLLKN